MVKFAARKKIDLIVIGTQGKRGLERLLLGSVAEEIIRSAPCKVLVVK
jgi:nucleotide-binding universal stress UspA family protein